MSISPLAEHLALPVVEDPRFDRAANLTANSKQKNGNSLSLEKSLHDLFNTWLAEPTHLEGFPKNPPGTLKLVVVQTSLDSLFEFLETTLQPLEIDFFKEAITVASEADRVPAVVAAGHRGGWPGEWVFDV